MTGKQPSVYILASYRRVLYVGVTADLTRRLDAHRRKLNPNSFTARYNVTQLVYVERHATMPAAIAREKQIKGWLRRKKIALIESLNPEWRDLSEEMRFW